MSILENLTSELEGIGENLSDDATETTQKKNIQAALDFIRTSPQAAEEIAEAFANMLDNAQRTDNAGLIGEAVERHYLNLRDYDPDNELSDFETAYDNTLMIDCNILGAAK